MSLSQFLINNSFVIGVCLGSIVLHRLQRVDERAERVARGDRVWRGRGRLVGRDTLAREARARQVGRRAALQRETAARLGLPPARSRGR